MRKGELKKALINLEILIIRLNVVEIGVGNIHNEFKSKLLIIIGF